MLAQGAIDDLYPAGDAASEKSAGEIKCWVGRVLDDCLASEIYIVPIRITTSGYRLGLADYEASQKICRGCATSR